MSAMEVVEWAIEFQKELAFRKAESKAPPQGLIGKRLSLEEIRDRWTVKGGKYRPNGIDVGCTVKSPQSKSTIATPTLRTRFNASTSNSRQMASAY